MKKLLLFLAILISYNTYSKSLLLTTFSYSNVGNNYTFYLNSGFNVGAGETCPRVKFFIDNRSNDTLYIKAIYNLLGAWPFMGCASNDTINYTNPYSDINYINVSSGERGYGPTGTDTIIVWDLFDSTFLVGTAGIDAVHKKEIVNLYPNPANQYISIQNADWQELLVYNTLGQEVLRSNKSLLQNEQLDIRSLPNGHYIISLFDKQKNRIGNGKFYKQSE